LWKCIREGLIVFLLTAIIEVINQWLVRLNERRYGDNASRCICKRVDTNSESNFRTYLHKCTSFHSIYNLREFVHLVNSVTKVAMKYERLYGEIWKCLASGLWEHWNFSNVCIWMLKNYTFPLNTFSEIANIQRCLCKYHTYSRRQWHYALCVKN